VFCDGQANSLLHLNAFFHVFVFWRGQKVIGVRAEHAGDFFSRASYPNSERTRFSDGSFLLALIQSIMDMLFLHSASNAFPSVRTDEMFSSILPFVRTKPPRSNK